MMPWLEARVGRSTGHPNFHCSTLGMGLMPRLEDGRQETGHLFQLLNSRQGNNALAGGQVGIRLAIRFH